MRYPDQRVGIKRFRVNKDIVKSPVEYVNGLEAVGGSEFQKVVFHDKVTVIHQVHPHLHGQVRMLIIG
ncbi:hypothetical protein D9M69_681060 [compost metagenome]